MNKTTLFRCLPAIAAIGLFAVITANAATRSDKGDIAKNLDIFNSLFKELQTNYVDTIDAGKSISTAINAMLNDIDPYTEYFPAEEQDNFKVLSTGEYGGIGSYIQQRTDGVYIIEPYEDSPAAISGLKAGDRIIRIDTADVTAWTSDRVSSKLKGQAGTNVSVTVVRPYAGEDSVMTFDIERRKIQTPAIPYFGTVGPDRSIGYISLSSFTDKAPEDVRQAFLSLKNENRIRGLILDLQGNGGGLLESAVKIVGMFVPKHTEVVRTRGRGALSEKVYKTTAAPLDTEIPIAVVIDGNSASASEIVAGSLQDLDRAVIVGGRSFGKGLVQASRVLPYDGVLKVTIAKYYIPSGRLIQAIDYSRRNPDGSVARIPDSLTTVYHTAAGREVRDGGGITPDVQVKFPDANRLTFNIVRDNWAFDYATRYAAAHPTIPPAREFVVTDSMFRDFKSTIDPEKFAYDRLCETVLTTLREAAEAEGYMTDSVAAKISELETMLHHDLNHDLDHNRTAIDEILSDEIVKRYYYQRGAAENMLRYDQAVAKAAEVLADKEEYNRILGKKN